MSDRVILGDLLRFYNPKGFKKVNKKDFNYKYSYAMKALKDSDNKSKKTLLDKIHKKRY